MTLEDSILAAWATSNRVTITLCWQAPGDTTPRRHTMVAYVN